MTISELILPEFEQEMAGTRKTLARLPADRMNWQAHPKSHTIGWVASHLAEIPTWVESTMHGDSWDLHPPGGEAYRTVEKKSPQEVLEVFDGGVKSARAAIASASDADFQHPWSLLEGGKVLMTFPRLVVIRNFILNHTIHHRAILTVYYRLNDIPVPALYGPSGDEEM